MSKRFPVTGASTGQAQFLPLINLCDKIWKEPVLHAHKGESLKFYLMYLPAIRHTLGQKSLVLFLCFHQVYVSVLN